MKEITARDIYTDSGLGLLDINNKSELNNYYHLLLCQIIEKDKFVALVDIAFHTLSVDLGRNFDSKINTEDSSILFTYEEVFKFSNKPTENDIVKEMI